MKQGYSHEETIAILYPGEMGSRIGELLRGQGHRVVTTLEGRSKRTAALCARAGIEPLESLADVVKESYVVFSIVPPAAAMEVASRYCQCAAQLAQAAIYVDANAISPQTACRVASLFSGTSVLFVDGSIHGLAARLHAQGRMYLSGEAAGEVRRFFGSSLRVDLLGDNPGTASLFKMMLGGMSKGLAALFLELALVAKKSRLLDQVLDVYRDYYAGVIEAVERLVPTYPLHAARRAEEMRELEETIQAMGLTPHVISGVQQTIAAISKLHLEQQVDVSARHRWTVKEVVEEIHRRTCLPEPTGEGGVSSAVSPGLCPSQHGDRELAAVMR